MERRSASRRGPGRQSMADKEKKVEEAQEPVTEQVEVERVGEAEKAEAEELRCKAIDDGIPVPDISRATYGEKA